MNGDRSRRLQEDVDHVAWLLGVAFSVQIVPAAGDAILHVVAGEVGAVGRLSREQYRAAWSSHVAQRASLVVAGIPARRSSKPGRTLAARSRPPWPSPKRTGRSPYAAKWPTPRARPCGVC